MIPQASNKKNKNSGKPKPVKFANNKRKTTQEESRGNQRKRESKNTININDTTNNNVTKFVPKDSLTVYLENDNLNSNESNSFKAKNYKEHRAYNELRNYIDQKVNNNYTIQKLTEAIIKIADRPINININQSGSKARRSKNNSRKRPNKKNRNLIRGQQQLIRENPLK